MRPPTRNETTRKRNTMKKKLQTRKPRKPRSKAKRDTPKRMRRDMRPARPYAPPITGAALAVAAAAIGSVYVRPDGERTRRIIVDAREGRPDE
jgi:hypothetical protein